MPEQWEGCPPRFADDDSTLADLRADFATLGLLEGRFYGETLRFLRDVLEAIEPGGLTLPELARLCGTGMHPGVFWGFLSWLCLGGVLMRGDLPDAGERYVLGPYGVSLLRGFDIYGVSPERWRLVPEEDA